MTEPDRDPVLARLFNTLSWLKSLAVAVVVLGGLIVASAHLARSCSGPDARQAAEARRAARRPIPGLSPERLGPDWGQRPGDRRVDDGATPDGRRWVEPE